MLRKSLLFITIVLIAISVQADDYIDLVKKGNEALKAKDQKKALEYYRQAETEIPESPELNYNLGGALHEEGKYEEAVDRFQRSLNTVDTKLESASHYNLGNTYFRMQDFQKAIASYQEALNLNPDDMDAKFNLELARKMLKEQIKPQQQNQQKQQQQQQQDQKDQQNQQQNQENQDQQQQQDQQEQKQQQDQKSPQPDKQKMNKEDAERILNALKDDEKDIQKKIQRQLRSGDYTGKDW